VIERSLLVLLEHVSLPVVDLSGQEVEGLLVEVLQIEDQVQIFFGNQLLLETNFEPNKRYYSRPQGVRPSEAVR
jgi:hypothetical protein